jgi:hypothetical protein
MRLRKILYFLIPLLWPLLLASTEAQDQKLHVAYDQGLLSVSLENAQLGEVLQVVGEKTGILIQSPEDLNKSITIDFDRRILRGINHVLIFSPSNKETGKETVSGVYIPSHEITGKRAPMTPRSVPRTTRPDEEEYLEEEGALGGVSEYGEDQEEDPVLERYESQLDLLEQQMEAVGQDSPQAKAIMSRIQLIQTQIEQRLDALERQKSQ